LCFERAIERVWVDVFVCDKLNAGNLSRSVNCLKC